MAGERTAPDVQRMGLQAEKIWREAERRIMEDVIRRIKKTGEITSTADYQINRLIEMGKSREEVERIIKEALGATWAEMFEMYDKVAEWEYVRNREIYEQVNDDFLTPEDNRWLQQLTDATKKQTKDTLVNMVQSYGFSVLMAGKRVFTPFAEYYQKYVDTAIQDVVTGGTDYNSAIRKVVTQMTNSGLRVVDYASGHTNRADVAARRAVLTGVNQITAQVGEHNAEKLDTEYFEVSWHPCARPDHQTWQGRVFSKKELGTVCGYGTVTGLCGANCRHTFHPFIPGVSERLYPDDWLEEQNQKEAKTKEWNGKQLNAYEQTQQQRKMETAMRAQRQKIRLLQEAGADKDDIMLEKAKYQGQLNEYKQFSKKMGLLEQRERIYQDGLGKVATNTKQQNARYTPEMMRNAKIDSNQYKRYREILKEDAGSLADFRQMKYNDPEKWEELKALKHYLESNPGNSSRDYYVQAALKEAGIKGIAKVHPVKLDVSDYSYDSEHINAERAHMVGRGEAERFIAESDLSLTRWNGRFVNYYSKDGATYVDVENKNIRTAFTKKEFDENTLKIREVIEKYAGKNSHVSDIKKAD